MKILCLYGNPCALPLFAWLERQGDTDTRWQDVCCQGEMPDLSAASKIPDDLTAESLDTLNGRLPGNGSIYPEKYPTGRGYRLSGLYFGAAACQVRAA